MKMRVSFIRLLLIKNTCSTLLSSTLSALLAKFGDLNELKKMTFVFPCEPHAVLRNVTHQDYNFREASQISAQSSRNLHCQE